MSRTAANDVPPDILVDDEREDEAPAAEAASDIDLDLEASPGSVKAGTEVIRRFWTTLPNAPGVYRMIDGKGEVLYVGKAKSLKSRVGSYARGQAHGNRLARMIADTASMEFVTTATETEALLLEANLIKQLRPRYNVLLRDDKSFPYILLTADHEAPQVVKHRGARTRPGHYFGPFANVWAVNRTLNALQRAFLLRSCNDSYYENRTRPCLLFQIKRCSGPCTQEIAIPEYETLVGEARAFLSGRSNAVKDRLAAEMNVAAENLEFERAARYRDRLAALSAVQATQGINTQGLEEADVFALDEQAGQFCVEVFFFRNWQNWGNRAYFPKAHKSMPPGEVLGSFLAQFYDDKPAPRAILVSHEIEDAELLAAALSTKSEGRVEVHVPKRGERKTLVDYALRNAKEALGRRLADTSSQQKLLASLGRAFGLPKAPRRIDVFDNSHIMGTNAVGAMIVAGPAGLMKQHYRTFNIKSEELAPGDDYGMMREVLRRRFSRLVKEAPRDFPSPLRGGVGVGGDGPDTAVAVPAPAADGPSEPSTDGSMPAPPAPLGVPPSWPSPQGGGVQGGSDLVAPSPAADGAREPSSDSSMPESPTPLGVPPSRPSPQGGGVEDGIDLAASSPAADGSSEPSTGSSMPESPTPAPSPGRGGAQSGAEPASENDEAFPAWPDLVLIDGGRGQLEAAQAALAEIGVTDVPLVAIAKGRDRDAGRETFFLPGKAPTKLPPRDPALYFVQRLRDEAHRFAIGAHRAKRKREMAKGPLDEIPGIGPTRKRALLHHFGTLKAIQRASYEDLVKTPGVNAATARTVYDFFHEGRG